MTDLNRGMLKAKAKTVLKGAYWNSFLVTFIIMIVSGGISTIISIPSANAGVLGSLRELFDVSSFSYSSYYSPYSGYSSPWGMGDAQWLGMIIVVVLVVFVIAVVLGCLFYTFVVAPLEVGAKKFYINSTFKKDDVGTISFAFSNGYRNVAKTMFLRALYPALWALIPLVGWIVSIYKSYGYAMVPYILADNPQMPAKRALVLSTQMMQGRRFTLFVQELSFFFWHLLAAVTFGISELFLAPYIQATETQFYMAVSTDAINRGFTNRTEMNLPSTVEVAVQ